MSRQLYRFDHQKLRDLVDESGQPLELLALKVGRTRPAIESYLRGRSVPPAPVVAALCDVLGCQPEDLLVVVPDAEHDALVHDAMIASRTAQGLPTTLPDDQVEAAAELLRLRQ
jgi:hypothetical protein